MKKFGLLVLSVIAFVGCDSDDDTPIDPPFEGETKEFQLSEISDSGVSGTATFTELEDNSVLLELEVEGTEAGDSHPAHIHFNSAAEGGDIAISLEPVDGETGISATEISSLDDGTQIDFETLVSFDGYINIHNSAEDLDTLLAQGDIGENELTGESVSYELATKDVEGISGTATFLERANGEALVVLDLEGTEEGNTHPAHIHMGAVADAPGDIAVTLTSVEGASGMSMSNISETDAEESISYEDLIAYDGYINVHQSAEDLETLIAQGNIGSNQ
ncbi:CHRD domain-containing protein [Christiangramia forsetii]|uniref:Secreted protein n=2 Tax=Christiangramia forsetii TaxID=411153 RepID=A0M0C4_CHRFK|nr:CHRD domain-containing protein [Christiangramia forsetii]GGG41261.1 hypothetical protein GCM10011532_26240 [Christiangramia forsetii]CAL66069.1 secreted protein [Christiangramia forsetii KT0803]